MHDVLTYDQYRARQRRERHLRVLLERIDPLEHAQRCRAGLVVIRRWIRLFRARESRATTARS